MKQDFVAQTQEYKKIVQQHIAAHVAQESPKSLYEPMQYALHGGGKFLRPILALVCCGAVGGNIDDALEAAAAIEIAHNFTLVHDDIMDNDELRRGRETVFKKWNANVGILAGDAILVKAYQALNNIASRHISRVLAEFNQGILMVCEGQALDMEFEDRNDVTLDEYFSMINRKTAQLFSLSCVIGAILGEGSEAQIEAFRTYGLRLGHAFQIQDDLLDLLADEETLGKDIGSDLQADKKTFLMLYTKENASSAALKELDILKQKISLSNDDIQHIINIMKESGAINKAEKEAKAALIEARTSLNHLEPTKYSVMLADLLDTLENRTF